MRSHYDKVTSFQFCGVDDGLVRMFLLPVDRLAWHARHLGCDGNCSQGLGGVFLHLPYISPCRAPSPQTLPVAALISDRACWEEQIIPGRAHRTEPDRKGAPEDGL